MINRLLYWVGGYDTFVLTVIYIIRDALIYWPNIDID